MVRVYSYIRKIVVLVIGVPLFVIGIILIPLPGPGLLVCFLALFIISLEYDFAKPHVERIKQELKKIWDTRHRFDQSERADEAEGDKK
jgi:uncharacterized protein (TIGR02611 family)